MHGGMNPKKPVETKGLFQGGLFKIGGRRPKKIVLRFACASQKQLPHGIGIADRLGCLHVWIEQVDRYDIVSTNLTLADLSSWHGTKTVAHEKMRRP